MNINKQFLCSFIPFFSGECKNWKIFFSYSSGNKKEMADYKSKNARKVKESDFTCLFVFSAFRKVAIVFLFLPDNVCLKIIFRISLRAFWNSLNFRIRKKERLKDFLSLVLWCKFSSLQLEGFEFKNVWNLVCFSFQCKNKFAILWNVGIYEQKIR